MLGNESKQDLLVASTLGAPIGLTFHPLSSRPIFERGDEEKLLSRKSPPRPTRGGFKSQELNSKVMRGLLITFEFNVNLSPDLKDPWDREVEQGRVESRGRARSSWK